MRRLTFCAALAALLLGGCKPRPKVHLEPTEEAATLASTVHMADPEAAPQLIRGFHQIEQNSWRWTARTFTVTLRVPRDAETRGAQVVAHFSLPDILLQRLGPITLTADLDKTRLGAATYAKAGEYTFTADLPRAALGDEPLTIDFQVDKFLPAGSAETRELGLIAESIGIQTK